MALVPYAILDKLKAGDEPATEEERRQWIAALRQMNPIPYAEITRLMEPLQ